MAKQKYNSVIVLDDDPKVFNDFITDNIGKYDLYLFGNNSVLGVNPEIETIYGDWLIKYPNEFIGAVYSDGVIVRNNESANYVLPQSSTDLFHKSIFYTPIIGISGKIQARIFNEKLKHIYFYDALKKISSNSLVVHCPTKCYSFQEQTFDLNEDVKNL